MFWCSGRKSRVSAVALSCVNATEPQPPPVASPASDAPSGSPPPPAAPPSAPQQQYALLVGTEAGELASVLVRVRGEGAAEEARLELGSFVLRAADAFSKCAPLSFQRYHCEYCT